MQKKGGTDQYALLANRIGHAVEALLARERSERRKREYRLITLDDTERYARGNIVPVTFEGGQAAQIVFTDVTEQKRPEAALKQERERFSALFENFPEPTVAYGFEDGTPVVRTANEAFGYDPEAVVGDSIDDLIVPPDRLSEARTLDERVQAGELIDRQIQREAADGERCFQFRNIPCPGGEDVDGFAVYADSTERVERE